MFEFPPFWLCPECKMQDAFGVLWVRENSYKRRCKNCGYKADFFLPDVDKKVIYIDQFAISNLFLFRSDRDKKSPLKDFWIQLHDQILNVLLLQGAIFPHSNIHLDESLVARTFDGLRDTYRSISGDTSLHSTHEIERMHLFDFAKSWITNEGVPALTFSVDDILEGTRNSWLSPIRIEANSDYSQFANDIRSSREMASADFAELFKHWATNKPTFQEVAKHEAASFGHVYNQQRAEMIQQMVLEITGEATVSLDDIMGQANLMNSMLTRLFSEHGVSEEDCFKKITEFFTWDGLQEIPSNKISAYMFAAIARKAASGQKRAPNSGMLNDIRVISTYMPYVDAMFLDNECAALLSEEPLKTDLNFSAQIFSLNNRDQFLKYLNTIETAIDSETRKRANDLYGVIS